MTISIHKCLRCDHEWPSRLPERPRSCARCKSVYWHVPRDPRRQAHGVAAAGASRLYKFHDLEVGQEIVEPWPDELAHRVRISRALAGYARRTGKKFHRIGQPQGLWIKRVA